ncbi:hypothetical protein GMRT_11416 [Giardia muris]|uniref:EF-hand domain-containing protein n=1 Tax=Giardia muris TaxID=5742 RepID=A0A4Z1SR00_GIAMU|nr:hypothetical protein GMRT_11416 [Giardia muris]|eukprot:TNJ28276.1 hypothetical protein GMRT_11416 [Giardia muris]
MGNPRIAAEQYLHRYNVPDLFDYLLSELVLHMPEDPWSFLASVCGRLESRAFPDNIPFFTREELAMIFHKYEVLERGIITGKQGKQALRAMGLRQRLINDLFIDDDASLTLTDFERLAVSALNARLYSWSGMAPPK